MQDQLPRTSGSALCSRSHMMCWSFAFSLFFFFNGEIIIYSLISSCFYGNSMAALGGEIKTSRENGKI